jgi:hypothetical protein
MVRFSFTTSGARRRLITGLAAALVALRRLARRRRLQLATFLVAGTMLGAGLMAVFADFGSDGSPDRTDAGVHRMSDADHQDDLQQPPGHHHGQ